MKRKFTKYPKKIVASKMSDIDILAREALECTTRDELAAVISGLDSLGLRKLFLHYMEMLRDPSLSVPYIASQLSDELICYYSGKDVNACGNVMASEICYRDRDNDDRVVALDVGMSDEDVEEMLAAHPSYYRSTLDRFDDVNACGNVMASSGIFYTDRGAGIGSRNQVFTEEELKAAFNSLLAEGDPIANSYDSFEAWRDTTLDSGLLDVEFLEEDVENPDVEFDETDIDATTMPKYFANMVSASRNGFPDFKTISEAQKFLDSQDPVKVELVEDCYYEILDLYADSDLEGFIHSESEVMRDYRSAAAEDWAELSVDEADKLFTEIYQAIETVRADEAAAWT